MPNNVCDDWCVRNFVLEELDGKIEKIVDHIIEKELDVDDSEDIASVLILFLDNPRELTRDEVEWACQNIQSTCSMRQLIDMGIMEEHKPGYIRLTDAYRK